MFIAMQAIAKVSHNAANHYTDLQLQSAHHYLHLISTLNTQRENIYSPKEDFKVGFNSMSTGCLRFQ